MSLEEEARHLAAQTAADDAARAEQESRERERRILSETPAAPAWTAELITLIENRYQDRPVYRVASSSTVHSGHINKTTIC